MKKIRLLIGILACSFLMISCNSETNQKINIDNNHIGNPTSEDILTKNKNADIFVLDGIVYKNAEKIDWVMERDLTLGKKLGEIRKTTKNSSEFVNFTASKLPIGAEIYEPVEKEGPILLVVDGDKVTRYLGLLEG